VSSGPWDRFAAFPANPRPERFGHAWLRTVPACESSSGRFPSSVTLIADSAGSLNRETTPLSIRGCGIWRDLHDILCGVLWYRHRPRRAGPGLRGKAGLNRLSLESSSRPMKQHAPRWPRGSQQPVQPRRPLIITGPLPAPCRRRLFHTALQARWAVPCKLREKFQKGRSHCAVPLFSSGYRWELLHNGHYRNRMLRRIWSGVIRPRAVKMQGDHGIPGTRAD